MSGAGRQEFVVSDAPACCAAVRLRATLASLILTHISKYAIIAQLLKSEGRSVFRFFPGADAAGMSASGLQAERT